MNRKAKDHSTSRAESWNRGKFSARQEYVEASDRRTLRSDRAFVLGRLVTIAIVYTVMARGIIVHQLPGGYLLLPFALEFLAWQWGGLFLARFVVDCDGFRDEMGKLHRPLAWTALVAAILVIAIGWSGDLQQSASRLWTELFDSWLAWIVLVEWIAMALATVPEVQRFRPGQEQFVWAYAHGVRLRFNALAGAFLLAWFIGIPSMFLPEPFNAASLLSWLAAEPGRDAWAVFALLVFVDLFALELGVWSHRRAKQRAPRTD